MFATFVYIDNYIMKIMWARSECPNIEYKIV
jgi:hypothetical protein